MSKSSLPVICVDFDGVVHAYSSPWNGATKIPDPPVPGALDALAGYINAGFCVYIFSTRCHSRPAIRAMRDWFIKHGGEPLLRFIRFSDRKVAAVLYVDDRGFHFTGTFPTPEQVRAFKPWNKCAGQTGEAK